MMVTLPPACLRPCVKYAARNSGLTAVPVLHGKDAVVTIKMRLDLSAMLVCGNTASPGLAGAGMGNSTFFFIGVVVVVVVISSPEVIRCNVASSLAVAVLVLVIVVVAAAAVVLVVFLLLPLLLLLRPKLLMEYPSSDSACTVSK